MSYDGLPKETLSFLEGLRDDNTKDRFDAHRADYEDHYLEPARDLVIAAGQ